MILCVYIEQKQVIQVGLCGKFNMTKHRYRRLSRDSLGQMKL